MAETPRCQIRLLWRTQLQRVERTFEFDCLSSLVLIFFLFLFLFPLHSTIFAFLSCSPAALLPSAGRLLSCLFPRQFCPIRQQACLNMARLFLLSLVWPLLGTLIHAAQVQDGRPSYCESCCCVCSEVFVSDIQ